MSLKTYVFFSLCLKAFRLRNRTMLSQVENLVNQFTQQLILILA